MPTRRQLLAATGAVAASSGCMGVLGDDGDDTAAASNEPKAVRLEGLSVQNNHDQAHRIQLAVEADDELLHLDHYELEANGPSTPVEGEWSDRAESYQIHARLDDSEIQTADVTEGISESASCVRVLVRIDSEGALDIWNGADCDS